MNNEQLAKIAAAIKNVATSTKEILEVLKELPEEEAKLLLPGIDKISTGNTELSSEAKKIWDKMCINGA